MQAKAFMLTFCARNESYLSGSFRSHAKRTKKTRHCVWQSEPHSLRRHLFATSLPDSDWFQKSSSERRSLSTTEQPLQRGRTVVGHSLSDRAGTRATRHHASVASQRCLSILEWLDPLSQPNHTSSFSLAHGSAGPASVAQAPRSLSHPAECQTTAAKTFDFRFGFHRADCLRKTRSCRRWLSPVQTGTKIVSSAALLRRADQRLLAWRTATRSCLYWCRSARPVGSLFCQASHWDQAGYHSRRQGFLRSQDHRLAGGRNARFVIAVKLHPVLKQRLTGLRYRHYRGNVSTAQFFYCPFGLKKRYRYVMIRRPQAEEPSEQLTLFKV